MFTHLFELFVEVENVILLENVASKFTDSIFDEQMAVATLGILTEAKDVNCLRSSDILFDECVTTKTYHVVNNSCGRLTNCNWHK